MADHEEHKDDHGGGGGGGHGGHGGGGHAEGEHEGAPEWLISFADNVALMMGFFVILLAMNMKEPTAGGIGGKDKNGGQPTDRMLDFVITMRKEFNNPIDLDSDDPAEAPLRKRAQELEAGQSRQPDDPGPGREHQAVRPTDFSNLGGNVNFEDDSSSLTETARGRARAIGSRIASQRFIIEIRGHSSPSEAQRRPHKAFALGSARAMAVAEQLASVGVSWSQMRLASCADNSRLTSREQSYDPELDRQNQRVEVIVTGEIYSPSGAGQPAAPASSPGH